MSIGCRTKNSILNQIAFAAQQTGFQRKKRGFNALVLGSENLSLKKEPTDPYFQFQWYLVSYTLRLCQNEIVLNVEFFTEKRWTKRG